MNGRRTGRGLLAVRLLVVCGMAAALVAVVPSIGSATGDRTVLEPTSRHYGTSYQELAGAWYVWAGEFPASSSPVTSDGDVDCSLGQSGKIWFLAGNFGGFFDEANPAVRRCSIPRGKALFFPIANTVFWAPEDGDTVDEVRRGANLQLQGITELSVELDGKAIEDPFAYRAQSPPGGFPLPYGPLLRDFGFEDPLPDPRQPAVADGYWILLAPLSRGSHEIVIHAGDGKELNIDVTYHLTVERHRT